MINEDNLYNFDPNEQDLLKLATAAIEAISSKKTQELTAENYQAHIEKAIIDEVRDLPEFLAENVDGFDRGHYERQVRILVEKINSTQDLRKIASFQIDLIYEYISLISVVQNGGDKGFTPDLAREVGGMDCSLSVWALKEKLQILRNNVPKFLLVIRQDMLWAY